MSGAWSVGGNPPLDAAWSEPVAWADGSTTAWLASGRDAYALAAGCIAAQRWRLPDVLCPVVATTLRAAGRACAPYRIGALQRLDPATLRGEAVVLLHDVGAAPPAADRAAAAAAAAVIEDRSLWAGTPAELDASSSTWAIGSLRKWLGVPGGWLRAPRPIAAPEPLAPPAAEHNAAFIAAAALRRLRTGGDDGAWVDANLRLAELAERSLGAAVVPRAMSRGAAAQLAVIDIAAHRTARRACAVRIGAALDAPPDALSAVGGAIGLRARVGRRDACVAWLRERGVYAPVHWRDGDWSAASGAAARHCADTLTLPCPPLAPDGLDGYAAVVAELRSRFAARAITLQEDA